MIRAFPDFVLVAAGNPLDPPPISEPVVIVVLGLLGLLTVGVLVLTFAKLCKDVLGRRDPIAVDIGAHQESGGGKPSPGKSLQVDITGFVATKTFEDHREEMRLRAVGLEKQISDVRHDFKEALQGLSGLAQLRDESSEKWRGEISEDVKETSLELASVKAQAAMIIASQHNMDQKLDRLIERQLTNPRLS